MFKATAIFLKNEADRLVDAYNRESDFEKKNIIQSRIQEVKAKLKYELKNIDALIEENS